MVIKNGDKVYVITRRLFDNDLRRHFAGVVEAAEGDLIRVRGFAFVYDDPKGDFVRREERRVRIFALSDAGLIVQLIPQETDVKDLKYIIDDKGRRLVTDGRTFSLNITEFGAHR